LTLLVERLLLLHFRMALGWRYNLQFHLQTFWWFVSYVALEVAEQERVGVWQT